MKLIVGLGNPGEKYRNNRHNVGFLTLDRLAAKLGALKWNMSKKFSAEIIQTKEYILAKPVTFMNESGRSVATICHFYKVKYEDLYLVHDDLDITLGNYKIQHGKGPQIHNGLRSVEDALGTDKFWNVRIGVENRQVRGNKGIPGVVYSLQDFTESERSEVEQVMEKVVDELKEVIF